jgi:hypothetical protein
MLSARTISDFLISLGFTEHNGRKNTVFSLSIGERQVLGDRIIYTRHTPGHLKRPIVGTIAFKLGLTEPEFLSAIGGTLTSQCVLVCLCIQLTDESMREYTRDPVVNGEYQVRAMIESIDEILNSLNNNKNWTSVERDLIRRKLNLLLPYQDDELAAKTVKRLLALSN